MHHKAETWAVFHWNPFIFVGYGINRFSFHTNPYISNVTQQGRFPYFELGLPVTILACITRALRAKQGERSNSKREKNMSRESRGGEIFSPPLILRFAQNAAFASLDSQKAPVMRMCMQATTIPTWKISTAVLIEFWGVSWWCRNNCKFTLVIPSFRITRRNY